MGERYQRTCHRSKCHAARDVCIPWPLRVMHWTNALAMIVMITSGWGIYNDSVIIGGLHFSQFLPAGQLGPRKACCGTLRECGFLRSTD